MPRKRREIDVKLAAEQYRAGWTLVAIGLEHGASPSLIFNRLVEAGVEIRDSSSGEIWTDEQKDRARRTANAIYADSGRTRHPCMMCQRPIRGDGHKGAGHFCSMRCAADWAEKTLIQQTPGA